MKRKLTSSAIKTSGMTVVGTTKPDNIAKKGSGPKFVKKVKVPRGSMVNLKYAESKNSMNDEGAMRKQDRMRKGL